MFIVVYEKLSKVVSMRQLACLETVYKTEETVQAAAQDYAVKHNCRTWAVEIPEIPTIEIATAAQIMQFKK